MPILCLGAAVMIYYLSQLMSKTSLMAQLQGFASLSVKKCWAFFAFVCVYVTGEGVLGFVCRALETNNVTNAS